MKRFFVTVLTLAFALAMAGNAALAQQKTVAARNAPDAQFFPLEDIKPGMKGVALTVFSGSEAEEFGIEILGVLPGFPNPKQSAIIARLSGKNAERTGVFGGMSGSPVYIDGRL
ncbi:MAG: hypothetical protein H7Y30_06315, partial [Pyrinomonadaceae bacterium]|nr:hypothetical protein [Pyrinomonadaceae bacterium]